MCRKGAKEQAGKGDQAKGDIGEGEKRMSHLQHLSEDLVLQLHHNLARCQDLW